MTNTVLLDFQKIFDMAPHSKDSKETMQPYHRYYPSNDK